MPTREPDPVRSLLFPAVVLIVGLLATWATGAALRASVQAQDAERFEWAADGLHDSITQRLDAYLAMLRAGAGVFTRPGMPTADQFAVFVERLQLEEAYPGVQGIGFAVRVSEAAVPGLVRTRAAQNAPEFTAWPDDPRPELYPILFLEPMDRRNRAALGYDMFTEPTRRAAMEQARDSGGPAASGPVTLVQEIDEEKQAGFLIYLPVYDGRGVPPTVEQRRERLRGFVYSPFRAGDLFEGILGRNPRPRVAFTIHDGAPEAGDFLYGTDMPEAPRFSATRSIVVGGREWVMSIVSTPALDESSGVGLVPYVLMSGSAITLLLTGLAALQARARLRAERSEARAEDASLRLAREANLKDEFLATLSHELRTPMNAIVGWAHLLVTEQLDERTRQKASESIQRNALLQSRLIEDLLDMSRIVSGQVRLDVRPLDMRDAVESAVDVVRPTANARGVALAIRSAPGAMVIADPTRMQQVLWNLLSNAIKFTPAGGTVTVTLDAAEAVVVTVHDTGIGITPSFLPHVFDRFRQADGTTTREHGGLGIGLAIVKTLVEMHGGKVRAASGGHGTGASFTVWLPRMAKGETEGIGLAGGINP